MQLECTNTTPSLRKKKVEIFTQKFFSKNIFFSVFFFAMDKKQRELLETLEIFAETERKYRNLISEEVAEFWKAARAILNEHPDSVSTQDKLMVPVLNGFTVKLLNAISDERTTMRELQATLMQNRADFLDGLDNNSLVEQTRELQGKQAFVHVNQGFDVAFGANLTTQSAGEVSLDPFSTNRANESPEIRTNIYNTQKHPKEKPTSARAKKAESDAMEVDSELAPPAAPPKKRPVGRPKSASVNK